MTFRKTELAAVAPIDQAHRATETVKEIFKKAGDNFAEKSTPHVIINQRLSAVSGLVERLEEIMSQHPEIQILSEPSVSSKNAAVIEFNIGNLVLDKNGSMQFATHYISQERDAEKLDALTTIMANKVFEKGLMSPPEKTFPYMRLRQHMAKPFAK